MGFSRRPFLVGRALRHVFEDPPRPSQRGVQVAAHVGHDIGERAALALDSPGELVDGGLVDLEAGFGRLVDHPEQRIFGKPAFLFRIATADIGMHA